MLNKFMILLEKDGNENNISGYVPAFRLGVVGDTVEEVIELAKELITLELQKHQAEGKPFPEDSSVMQTVEVDLERGVS